MYFSCLGQFIEETEHLNNKQSSKNRSMIDSVSTHVRRRYMCLKVL